MVQVTIIGLGTVGVSLGMALEQALAAKSREGEVLVTGYDKDPKAVEEALVRGAINQITRDLAEAVKEADLVIIAQPTPLVGETLRAIGPLLQAGCVVTDTASSKVQVLQWAEQYLPAGVQFIGGHPLLLPRQEVDWEAGTKAAKIDLFHGAVYCLAPALTASEEAVDMVRNLAQLVGASPFFVDAEEHDGLLAGLSYAPYVLAAAMLATIAESPAWRDLKLLADPAFRHLNQVLVSRPADFYQTCLSNRAPLVSWLDRVIAALYDVRQEMADPRSSGLRLRELVEKARVAYQDWTRRRDERQKELEATGTQQLPGAKDAFLGLFLPRRGDRRGGKRER